MFFGGLVRVRYAVNQALDGLRTIGITELVFKMLGNPTVQDHIRHS